MITLSSVRASWLMLARNADLAERVASGRDQVLLTPLDPTEWDDASDSTGRH